MEEWRQQLIESLERLFDKSSSSLYGLDHALAVEQRALELAKSRENGSTKLTKYIRILQAAALLHDVGFAERKATWSKDGFEHIDSGMKLSSEILNQNPFFRNRQEDINHIVFLIQHHDGTTYSYPTTSKNGRPVFSRQDRHAISKPNYIKTILAFLKETDARIHTDDRCIQEAFEEWVAHGIPIFSASGPPLSTWRWNDSVIGNIRLLGKRNIVDANTQNGCRTALKAYNRLEEIVKNKCEDVGVPYEPEICSPLSRQTFAPQHGETSFELQIVSFKAWDEFKEELRSISLKGDPSIKPYKNAKMELRLCNLSEISPMALYVINDKLEFQSDLCRSLMLEYALGLSDLPGLLGFKFRSQKTSRIGPPVFESYIEKHDSKGERHVIALVDGLHRCMVARNNGTDRVYAIVVSDVPYPLVPLPVKWGSITTYEKAPKSKKLKRNYRFETLNDFPDRGEIKNKPKDDEQARYFYFRDLGVLGSKGIRN